MSNQCYKQGCSSLNPIIGLTADDTMSNVQDLIALIQQFTLTTNPDGSIDLDSRATTGLYWVLETASTALGHEIRGRGDG